MNNVKELHDGGAVVGNGRSAFFKNQFIHTTWAKSRAHDFNNGGTSVDVGNKLPTSLGGVGTFLEQNDRWTLFSKREMGK